MLFSYAHQFFNACAIFKDKEQDMNTDIAKGKWNQLTGKVKQKWGKLTDDEVEQMEGNFEEFYGKMQEKYGMSRDKARQEFDSLNS
jgi:uncharacterized protein YjbJ (UPF0337 family)|tara:strand:+ start:8585 stop:8842 length:258 start_codon:yes stop_codon:yes gene_type:complete